MHQKNNTFTNNPICLYLLIIAGISLAFIMTSQPALADSMPGGNVKDPTVRAVDLAQPAVVRIITTVPGQLSVHFPPSTDVNFPQKSTDSYEISLSGTGAFITSQGDILTADHVVNPPRNQQLSEALYGKAAQDVADYMNKNVQKGSDSVTADQVLQQLTSGQLKSTSTFQKPGSSVFLSTSYTGLTNASNFQSLPAGAGVNVDQIKKESPSDQQDTAIVHVPMTDTLSVSIGDSTNVHPQDKLTIVGFPGNADVGKSPDSLLTSSLNQIYVSSLKTSDAGAPLIQVGGNVEHGDSGGPALDNQGTIVGIVSFGVDNNSNGPNGTSFLQASSSAQAMVKSLNLDTKSGKQQTLWGQAFNAYAATDAGHWGQAQQNFASLQKGYPLFKASQQFYDYAQKQAKNGPITTPSPQKKPSSQPSAQASTSWQAIALTVGSILLVIVLVGAVLASALRPRNKIKKQQPVASANRKPLAATATPGDKSQPDPANRVAASPSPQKTPGGAPSPVGQNTLSLKIWPCGHMNRPGARFCTICGEPAPLSPDDA
ncbi:trypsin-like peptidase domain-containing protein [Dictyobacter vulcani]|nr:trypsin-like peptidase domain-containing protein [Dictyobacter vulcani]